jgi:hypothetical protein
MSTRRYKRLRGVSLALFAVMAMSLNGALGIFVAPVHAAPGQQQDIERALAFTCAFAEDEAGSGSVPASEHHAACCDACPLHVVPVALLPDLQVIPVVWRQAATLVLPCDTPRPARSPLSRSYASRAPPASV